MKSPMPPNVRVMTAYGITAASANAKANDWAVKHGVRIVNVTTSPDGRQYAATLVYEVPDGLDDPGTPKQTDHTRNWIVIGVVALILYVLFHGVK